MRLLRCARNDKSKATVAGVLSEENVQEVLEAAEGKSEEEIRSYVARYRPKSIVPKEVIRPLSVVKSESKPSSLFEVIKHESSQDNRNGHGGRKVSAAAGSSSRFELKFSVSGEVRKKLDRVLLSLSGKYPRGASLETAFEELLD